MATLRKLKKWEDFRELVFKKHNYIKIHCLHWIPLAQGIVQGGSNMTGTDCV